MSRLRPRFIPHLVPILVATLLISVAFVAAPAAAGGTPYSAATWAGVRVSRWKANGDAWTFPRVVKASWQIPCLPTTWEGVDGAYDQWIGIEDANGTSLLQVGVRSYRFTFWNQVLVGYFAWVVNTNDPNWRTPREVFRISRCGMGEGAPVVTAAVDAIGRASISAVFTGTDTDPTRPGIQEPAPYNYSGPRIGAPAYGSFVVERFSLNQSLPQFGSARFRQGWVGGYPFGYLSGWSIGAPSDLVERDYCYMLRRKYKDNPPPSWVGWAAYAVVPWGADQYGNVELRQLSVD